MPLEGDRAGLHQYGVDIDQNIWTDSHVEMLLHTPLSQWLSPQPMYDMYICSLPIAVICVRHAIVKSEVWFSEGIQGGKDQSGPYITIGVQW